MQTDKETIIGTVAEFKAQAVAVLDMIENERLPDDAVIGTVYDFIHDGYAKFECAFVEGKTIYMKHGEQDFAVSKTHRMRRRSSAA